MSMQYAFKAKVSKHILEDNIGQLICTDVILARDGTYEYSSDEVFRDGKFNIIELHRDWEDVKKLKYTLEGKPVVYYHPDRDTDIDVNNIADFTVGHLQNVRESEADGYNVLIGDLFISDKKAIEAIKSGKLREISLGYFYEIDDKNKNYLKQIDMVAEHIALVTQGRAGIARILDASSTEYVLAKLRKDEKPLYLQFYEEAPDKDMSWFKLMSKGSVYGYYKFSKNIEPDQSTPVTLQMIGLIVKNVPTGAFAVIDKTQKVVQTYLFGKKVESNEIAEEGYSLDDFSEVIGLDPYDIPDEIHEKNSVVETKQKWYPNDIIVLGGHLEKILRDVDKAFRHSGDNYRGIAWDKMVALLQHNKETVEEFTKWKFPEDKNDGEYLYIAEMVAVKARKLSKRAHDELFATMIVVAFDAEKSDVAIAVSIKEAVEFFKKHGKKIKQEESLEKFIDMANEVDGVYIVRHDDFEKHIIVSRAVNEFNVEVYVSENIEEINKRLAENFKTLEEAYTSINTKEGRFSKMSAIVL